MVKLLTFNFLIMVLFNFAHPVTPDMLVDKNAPEYLNGILYALMSLSMFLFSPFWGYKTKEIGVKRILVLAPIGYGIMQQLFAFAPGSILMGVGRFSAGVFSAGWIVALTIYVNYYSTDDKKSKNFGYIMVTNGLASAVGQMLAGTIGEAGGVYTYLPFILQLVGTLIVALLVQLTLKDIDIKTTSNTRDGLVTMFKKVKANGHSAILLLVLTLAIASNIYSSNIGYYAVEQFNFDSQQVAYINSYSGIVIMLMNLFAIGLIEKYLGILRGIKAEFIVGLVAFGLVFVLPLFPALIMLGLFVGATSIYRPLVQKYLVNKEPENASELMGIINSVNSLGMIIGAVLSGLLFAIRPNAPFYAIIIILIIGLLIYINNFEKNDK